ncbi:MAG: branched-chain amino acid ABC transporter permease, partial [Parvibaculaceae bacterium]
GPGLVGAGAFLLLSEPALAQSALRSTGYAVQQVVNASLVGALYSLLAVAYALLHGITNRIVLSFGDLATFGAFATIYPMMFMLFANWQTGLAIAMVFVMAAAAAAALGAVLQVGVFTPLVSSPTQAIMIASIGVSITLQESLRVQSGGREQWLSPIFAEPLVALDFDGFVVHVSGMQVIILGLAAVLLTGLAIVLARSRAGRLWRACSQNLALARLCGIDTGRVLTWTGVAAAAFAAASGWIIAIGYGGVSFYMGLVLGLKALFATIIGGFGTIGGAIVGGFLLAGVETLWSAYFPIVYRDVAVFLVVILIFIVKPDGLLSVGLRRDSEA